MLGKILKFMVGLFMACLVIGISFQYYISQPIEPQQLVCYKGRLLAQVGDVGAVYTKIKGLTCDIQKGMLIIEEQ